MGSDHKISETFDAALWRAGVEGGAFASPKSEGCWYTLEEGGVKIALAVAAPGPGDLTNIAYYVVPAFRNQGHGTKLARYIADRHEKASFLVKKDNEASVKVALAALRGKFAATEGRHVVRITKESATWGLAMKPIAARRLAFKRLREQRLGQEVHPGLERRRVVREAEIAHDPSQIVGSERQMARQMVRQARRQYGKAEEAPEMIQRAMADIARFRPALKGAADLSGGLAEKERKKPADFDPKALAQGTKVEMEHTDDPKKAKRIAMDHLTEYPTYYTELKKMEKKLEEKKAIDIFGHPIGFMGGGMAGQALLGKHLPFAGPVGGAVIGGQIAKRKFAPKPPSAEMKAAAAPPKAGLIPPIPKRVPAQIPQIKQLAGHDPKLVKAATVRALRRMVDPMVRKGPWLAASEKKPMGREALLESILGDAQATAAGK